MCFFFFGQEVFEKCLYLEIIKKKKCRNALKKKKIIGSCIGPLSLCNVVITSEQKKNIYIIRILRNKLLCHHYTLIVNLYGCHRQERERERE